MAIRLRLCAILSAILIASTSYATDESALHIYHDRIFLPISVNGHQEEALLDSAAEVTLVDVELARTLNLHLKDEDTVKGSGGESSVRFADNVTVRAAGLTLEHLNVAVLDLRDVSARLVGKPVAIVLGRELFDAARLEIDIERGIIRTLARTTDPDGTELKLTSTRGIESVPAQVEGTPVQADFDLGNGSEVLIGRKFAQLHGLTAASRIVERKSGGGLGGGVQRDVVLLSTLQLAGHTFSNVRAAIDDQSNAGDLNIGISVLRPFVIVTDFAEHRIWLRFRDR